MNYVILLSTLNIKKLRFLSMKKRIEYPEVLMISGAGRNVGKTILGCNIFDIYKDKRGISIIKIASHKHQQDNSMILLKEDINYCIWKENSVREKDSGKYFSIGAKNVFYIEALDDYQFEAFLFVKDLINNDNLIICETGRLAINIKAGVMLFVQKREAEIEPKKQILKDLCDKVIYTYSEEILNPELFIYIENGKWKLL